MSGEPPSAQDWFDATFRFFETHVAETDRRYEQRFIAQQEAIQAALLAQKEAVNAALVAADRAVIKAETASEKRFESVNEFRATLADQASGLMPRAEAESRISAITEKLADLSDRINRGEGKGVGISQAWAVVVVFLAIVVDVGVRFIHP